MAALIEPPVELELEEKEERTYKTFEKDSKGVG